MLTKIFSLLTKDSDFKKRVIKGGFWVFALRIFRRAFEFIRTLVLARVLAPEDFGLMGIALLAMSALKSFSQTGVQQALIQKKGNIKEYLDTAWTIQVIRGCVITGILFLGAPFVGKFFGEPNAVPLTRALALSELFKGFVHIGVVNFQKELKLHKEFVCELSANFADMAITLPIAYIYKSVWALLFGLLMGNFVRLVLSHIIISRPLNFKVDKGKIKHLFKFGKWIFISSVLVFIIVNGDDIFLGKILGTTALGLYQMAYKLSNIAAREVTSVISKVMFPAYSKVQHKTKSLRKGFVRVIQLTSLFSFPLAIGTASIAFPFTLLLLGEKWIPMVTSLQVLTGWGLIRTLDAATSPVWQAMGKPKLSTIFQFLKIVILAVLIYPMTIKWGILGTSLAILIESIIVHISRYTYMAKTLECKPQHLFKHFLVPGISSIIMGMIVLFTQNFFDYNLITLFILILLGTFVYIISIFTLGSLLGFKVYKKFKDPINNFAKQI
jgi:O-antigen/teichoic acid export membrane protein